MLYLTKLLPVFAYPLGAAILVGLVVLALLIFGRIRIARVLLALALAGLWVAATPAFSNWIGLRLELRYPPVPIEALPQADAIILLGGIAGWRGPPSVTPDFGSGVDRALLAARLYHAGKAPRIVVSAGMLPWVSRRQPEAEVLAGLLGELGVPRTALLLDARSANTHQNAIETAAIFRREGLRTGLLVTSGIHMPRALETFRAQGLDVTPATTDIHGVTGARLGLLSLLPQAESLSHTTYVIKEMIGLIAYRWLGWMQPADRAGSA